MKVGLNCSLLHIIQRHSKVQASTIRPSHLRTTMQSTSTSDNSLSPLLLLLLFFLLRAILRDRKRQQIHWQIPSSSTFLFSSVFTQRSRHRSSSNWTNVALPVSLSLFLSSTCSSRCPHDLRETTLQLLSSNKTVSCRLFSSLLLLLLLLLLLWSFLARPPRSC